VTKSEMGNPLIIGPTNSVLFCPPVPTFASVCNTQCQFACTQVPCYFALLYVHLDAVCVVKAFVSLIHSLRNCSGIYDYDNISWLGVCVVVCVRMCVCTVASFMQPSSLPNTLESMYVLGNGSTGCVGSSMLYCGIVEGSTPVECLPSSSVSGRYTPLYMPITTSLPMSSVVNRPRTIRDAPPPGIKYRGTN